MTSRRRAASDDDNSEAEQDFESGDEDSVFSDEDDEVIEKRSVASDDEDETEKVAEGVAAVHISPSEDVGKGSQHGAEQPREESGSEADAADDEEAGSEAAEQEQEAEAPAVPDKKEREPFEVPTSGAFWMHDDRFGGEEEGQGRKPRKPQKLWDDPTEEKWEHDKFALLDLPPEEDDYRGSFNRSRSERRGGRGSRRDFSQNGPRQEAVESPPGFGGPSGRDQATEVSGQGWWEGPPSGGRGGGRGRGRGRSRGEAGGDDGATNGVARGSRGRGGARRVAPIPVRDTSSQPTAGSRSRPARGSGRRSAAASRLAPDGSALASSAEAAEEEWPSLLKGDFTPAQPSSAAAAVLTSQAAAVLSAGRPAAAAAAGGMTSSSAAARGGADAQSGANSTPVAGESSGSAPAASPRTRGGRKTTLNAAAKNYEPAAVNSARQPNKERAGGVQSHTQPRQQQYQPSGTHPTTQRPAAPQRQQFQPVPVRPSRPRSQNPNPSQPRQPAPQQQRPQPGAVGVSQGAGVPYQESAIVPRGTPTPPAVPAGPAMAGQMAAAMPAQVHPANIHPPPQAFAGPYGAIPGMLPGGYPPFPMPGVSGGYPLPDLAYLPYPPTSMPGGYLPPQGMPLPSIPYPAISQGGYIPGVPIPLPMQAAFVQPGQAAAGPPPPKPAKRPIAIQAPPEKQTPQVAIVEEGAGPAAVATNGDANSAEGGSQE